MTQMRLLLCRGWSDDEGVRIETCVRAAFPGLAIEYVAVESLARRLKRPEHPGTVAVLLIPAGASELGEMVAGSELYGGSKVLLVLPDHDPATIAIGHRLRPRLMAFSDGDPAQVCSVLDKIIIRQLSGVVSGPVHE